MANAGNSSDHLLCHAVTSGRWKYNGRKWISEVIKLPQHKDEDDKHQTALKNLVFEYYNIFHEHLEIRTNNWRNLKLRSMQKIIYRMNQYRQKNWYWKVITH